MESTGSSLAVSLDAAKIGSAEYREVMNRIKAFRHWVQLRPEIIDAAGDLACGIILERLLYWFDLSKGSGKVRATIRKDGIHWIARTLDGWWDECRLTRKQVIRALKKLQAQRLIVVRRHKFNGSPTLHIAINWPSLLLALNSLNSPNGTYKCTEGLNQKAPKGTLDNAQRVTSITETTPEKTDREINIAAAAPSQCSSSLNSDTAFTRPTLQEVTSYVRSLGGSDLDGKAHDFFSKYESQDWRVNGEPVRFWRKLVDGWKKNWDKAEPPSTTSAPPPDKHLRLLARIEQTKTLNKRQHENTPTITTGT